MKTREELFAIPAAASELGVMPKTLRTWIAAGRVAVVRPMGWAIRVPASEIDRIRDEGSIPARRKGL